MTDHVKIYGVKPRIQYVADGTLITYEFPFAIFKTTDINVYFGDTLQDSATYTVTGARQSDGGSVTFEAAPAAGTMITIVRNLSIERTNDFQEGGALRANTLNDELDYQIACQQQIAEHLNRSMVLPPYAADNNLDLTLPTPSAGKAIVWNADGTNLENSTVEVNALESTLKGYKTAAESAASTATEKASVASNKADLATSKAQLASDKADVATAKAAEATSTLASKASQNMDNLSATGKENIVALGMPDYSAPVSKNWDTAYLADYDCVVNYQTNHQSGNDNVGPRISSDGTTFTVLRESNAGSGSFKISGEFYVPKGWYWKMVGGRNVDRALKIYPLKGVV